MEIVSARRTARSFLRALFPIGGNAFGPAAVAAEPQPPQEPWPAPRTHQHANPHHNHHHQGGAGPPGGGSMRRGSAGTGPTPTAAAAAPRGGGAPGGTAALEPGGLGSLSHASHRTRTWMLGSAGAASAGRPAPRQLPQGPHSPTQQQLGPYPHPVPPAAQDPLWAAYQVSSSVRLASAYGGHLCVGSWGSLHAYGAGRLGVLGRYAPGPMHRQRLQVVHRVAVICFHVLPAFLWTCNYDGRCCDIWYLLCPSSRFTRTPLAPFSTRLPGAQLLRGRPGSAGRAWRGAALPAAAGRGPAVLYSIARAGVTGAGVRRAALAVRRGGAARGNG